MKSKFLLPPNLALAALGAMDLGVRCSAPRFDLEDAEEFTGYPEPPLGVIDD